MFYQYKGTLCLNLLCLILVDLKQASNNKSISFEAAISLIRAETNINKLIHNKLVIFG